MIQSTEYTPGARVRITQQIPFGEKPIQTTFEGVVVRAGQQKTGSWYAHALDNKVWLDRLEIRKDDGERVVVNLDHYTRVEPVSAH